MRTDVNLPIIRIRVNYLFDEWLCVLKRSVFQMYRDVFDPAIVSSPLTFSPPGRVNTPAVFESVSSLVIFRNHLHY